MAFKWNLNGQGFKLQDKQQEYDDVRVIDLLQMLNALYGITQKQDIEIAKMKLQLEKLSKGKKQ